jgi:hypothetical protein
MPVLIIPVWAWINAVVLIAAGAFVWGKLSGEAMPKRDKTHHASTSSSAPKKA